MIWLTLNFADKRIQFAIKNNSFISKHVCPVTDWKLIVVKSSISLNRMLIAWWNKGVLNNCYKIQHYNRFDYYLSQR